MSDPIRRIVLILLTSIWMAAAVYAQLRPEEFDGSYRLETGEVITGGFMVEGGEGVYVFMDAVGLEKGGLFRRVGEHSFRSVSPGPAVEIKFSVAGEGGVVSGLWWSEEGKEPVRGERVFPHQSLPVVVERIGTAPLEGRLLVPRCPGPHPVVVSVHGSGPVNRFGGPFHTFFLQHGVAVLAYDKRGFTTDEEAWREPDLRELAADAAAAARLAASHPEVDDGRIGLFGSSQAGWVVPPAAVAAKDTDFVILRAGAALTSAETVLHEVRQELRAEGLRGLELDHAMHLRREVYEMAMRGDRITATDALVEPYLEESWYRIGFGEGPISRVWSLESWRWKQRNHAWTAIPYLEKLDRPVLWFLAEEDENVPLVTTRAALERAFDESPGENQEVVVIEDATHSFLVTTPDGTPRYASGFFDRMGRWLEELGISDIECWQKESSGDSTP